MATVQVPSVWPPGSSVSITGQVVAGDGHLVGATTGAQFGTFTIGGAVTKAVGSVPSVASFGLVTAVSFGAQVKPLTGLGTAQVFGTLTTRLAFPVGGGVPSAAQFGVVTIYTRITVAVPGVQPLGIQTSITGQVICGDGHLVGGFNPYFGQIIPVMNVTLPTAPEAGLKLGSYAVTYKLSQAPNPQPAGLLLGTSTVDAFQVFLWDSVCIDEDLVLSSCTDIDLDDSPAAVEVDLVLAPVR